jgi:hypothetical protein
MSNASTASPLWRLCAAAFLFAASLLPDAALAANLPPIANNDSATTAEDTAVAINVLANDSDPNGDVIRIAINTPIVTPPQYGVAVRTSDSVITYTPAANFFGSDSFRYRIADGSLVASAMVTITVTAVNDPPIARDDNATTPKNTPIDIVVTANDSDPEGAAPTLISSPVVVAPTRGSAIRFSASTIRYTPNANQWGSDRFQYEIGDGSGARSRAWVNITITDVNRPPIANTDFASTRVVQPVEINVVANDTDQDGDPLSLTSTAIVVQPLNGTTTRLSATNIRYQPRPNWYGSDSFQYEIEDGRGGRARGLVNVVVISDNYPPVARDDSAFINRNTPVVIDVLANDSDPDGNPLRLVTPNPFATQPIMGTASPASSHSINYTPFTGLSGTDTFRYLVTDGTSISSATVTVIVNSVNLVPVAVVDRVVVEAQRPIVIDVLANDYDPDFDPFWLDHDQPFTNLPAGGTVTRLSDREVRYQSRPGFTGDDYFVYRITDSPGQVAHGTVFVYVESTAPVASSIAADTISRGAVSRLTVSGGNLQNAEVDIAKELFVKGQPPRSYPGVKLVSAATDGSSLIVDVDAIDPAVEGFFNLSIETPAGRTAIAFRVLAEALTVDLYSPSEAVAGNVHLFHLVGAGLAGASVDPLGEGIRVLELDNSNDHHLVGLLYVASDAPPGDQEIRVGTGSGSTLLPLRLVVDAGEATLPIAELRLPGRPSGGAAPAFYLQQPQPMADRPMESDDAKALEAEAAVGCEIGGYQVRHSHSSRLAALAEALEARSLPEESPATLEVETWLDLRFRYWICNGRMSDVTACFAGGSSWTVPQEGGQSSSFNACGGW